MFITIFDVKGDFLLFMQGELEGSKLYNKLLEDARRFFHLQLTDSEQ